MTDKKWEELREKFFNECVDKYDYSDPKINTTPHNIFEWFKQNVKL